MKFRLTSTRKSKTKIKTKMKSKRNKHLLRSLLKKKGDGSKKKPVGNSKFKLKPNWKIYTLQGCPYCEKAINLIKQKKQHFEVLEFVKLTQKQKDVVEKNQGRDHQTFPRIFKDHTFIGGFEDLQKLFSI